MNTVSLGYIEDNEDMQDDLDDMDDLDEVLNDEDVED